MNTTAEATPNRTVLLTILVSALGYFVDVFDLLLFSVVRTASLRTLGVPEQDLLTVGLRLLNMQMLGLLAGGLVFGVFADRFGRRRSLFLSIGLYSVATIANAFVADVHAYMILRFAAGFGLAGELGAAVTLVSELMAPTTRGLGAMAIAGVGLLGAVAASFAGAWLTWQQAYIVGGVLGLALLAARVSVPESPMFAAARSRRGRTISWAALGHLKTLLVCVGVGLPTYFVVGLVVTAAPEIGAHLGIAPAPTAGTAVMACYLGMTVGDFACSAYSQVRQSRKKAFALFNLIAAAILVAAYLVPPASTHQYFWYCAMLGFSVGYWALLSTNATESFPTAIRATATTLTPNLVRATTVPLSAAFGLLKEPLGIGAAVLAVGFASVAIALVCCALLQDGFHRRLDEMNYPT